MCDVIEIMLMMILLLLLCSLIVEESVYFSISFMFDYFFNKDSDRPSIIKTDNNFLFFFSTSNDLYFPVWNSCGGFMIIQVRIYGTLLIFIGAINCEISPRKFLHDLQFV